ncbi:MAG: hypothetical protein AYP45_14045 [Candidatus Brocadia carolinensis]|uniref:Ammonium transporter AmtB-like domain-containing protein n=1 Tax=Candidatus Brocadia carolinensis TaxID=1004156 RepID=A0A1V4AR04_9BACT|nr:MAG: hypothetical protein AYP45_14045 [Candidatus Brocadia caroliniensis]
MSIRRFLNLCIVLGLGLLSIPLFGVIRHGYGAEVLPSQSMDHAKFSIHENQDDLHAWSSLERTSGLNAENHTILLASSSGETQTTSMTEHVSAQGGSHEGAISKAMEDFLELAKYGKAIHVMAMLMVGFGFLMVFVKKYGYGAVTATYIAVSVVLPYYMFLKKMHIFGEPAELTMDRLILAEFCAASILIAMGAFLGRLKMSQYIIMALIFVPSYMLNEWIMLDNGMGLIPKGQLIDTGGSIVIHQFGAYFGLGVIVRMTTSEDFNKKNRI